MWHLVCGDVGAESVRLWLGEQADDLRVLRDDLAVGPLADVDTPPCTARQTFWRQVWPAGLEPLPDFTELAGDARWLAELAAGDRAVCVWHGDSCSEQLLLARVAAWLEGSTIALFEVPCGTGDSRVSQRRALGMIAPSQLPRYAPPRPVSAERQAALAAQWHEQRGHSAEVRRWQHGAFSSESFSVIDAALVIASGCEWRPLARAMAEVMAHGDGFFASDLFLYWRARELVAAGRLQLSGDEEDGYAARQVRRAD